MSASLSLHGHGAAPSRPLWRGLGGAALALVLLGGGYALVAQVAGERGIAPTAASADIEVKGISVDVTADSAEEARAKGWREAQRKAWEKIKGPQLSEGQLDGLVSAIVIERERLGPRRYIATLGVVFDRQRASGYLGGGERAARSAPMLLIPVEASGGTYVTFEQRNAWQRAWAEFNPGSSRINYVRPSGAGGDSLLINFGQTGRHSRAWWRSMLDQYGASDALMAFARLDHQFPGGPVSGTFTARYGPPAPGLVAGVYSGLLGNSGERLVLAGMQMPVSMSEDFALAIEEGSTMVRVGTALFGVFKRQLDHADQQTGQRRQNGDREEDAARRVAIRKTGRDRPAGKDQEIADDPADFQQMAGDQGRRWPPLPQDDLAGRRHAGKTRQRLDFMLTGDELFHSSGS